VGTRLVTGAPGAALGGVYKLSAVRKRGGPWQPRIKLSDQTAKVSVPGILQVRRFSADGLFAGDLIHDVATDPGRTLVDMLDLTRRKTVSDDAQHEDLLVPAARGGKQVRPPPSIAESRARTQAQLAQLHPGIKRFVNPHAYPVGLSPALHDERTRLILQAREAARRA
jgi:nicotinate phosphoribosyltransferase